MVDLSLEELSNSLVAEKLHYLRGGIAAWLHEAVRSAGRCAGLSVEERGQATKSATNG